MRKRCWRFTRPSRCASSPTSPTADSWLARRRIRAGYGAGPLPHPTTQRAGAALNPSSRRKPGPILRRHEQLNSGSRFSPGRRLVVRVLHETLCVLRVNLFRSSFSMAYGDLTTLSDVKAWLQTGQNPFPATDDALLARLVTAASEFIQNWRSE